MLAEERRSAVVVIAEGLEQLTLTLNLTLARTLALILALILALSLTP